MGVEWISIDEPPLYWGNSTPRFRSHPGALRTGDSGTSDDFRSGPAWPPILGRVRAAGAGVHWGRPTIASPPGRGCQAESAGGNPPARAIIASNASATVALKSDPVDLGQLGKDGALNLRGEDVPVGAEMRESTTGARRLCAGR